VVSSNSTEIEITAEMMNFCRQSNELWNSQLARVEGRATFDQVSQFSDKEREFLREIVLEKYGVASLADKYLSQPIDEIVVRGDPTLDAIKLSIGTENHGRNIVWSDFVYVPAAAIGRLTFYDFFDWDFYTARTFAMIRAVNNVRGQRVLLLTDQCRFFLLR
jgi:hypothetical protein